MELPAVRVATSHLENYTGRSVRLVGKVISNDGDPEERGIEHTLDAKISTIGIEPVAYIYPARRFKINLGLRIGYILQAEYEQYERLPKPTPAPSPIQAPASAIMPSRKFLRSHLGQCRLQIMRFAQ